MKKILLICFTILVCFGTVCGCGKKDEKSAQENQLDLSQYKFIGGNQEAEELVKSFNGNIEPIGDKYSIDDLYDYNIRNINIKVNEFFGKGTPIKQESQNIERNDGLTGNLKNINVKMEGYYDSGYKGYVASSGLVRNESDIEFNNKRIYIFAQFDEDFTGYRVVKYIDGENQTFKSFPVNAKKGDIAIWKLNSNSDIIMENIYIYYVENSDEANRHEYISLPIDDIYYNRTSNFQQFIISSDFTEFSLNHNTEIFDKSYIFLTNAAIIEVNGEFRVSEDSTSYTNDTDESNSSKFSEKIEDERIYTGELIGEPQKIKALYIYSTYYMTEWLN